MNQTSVFAGPRTKAVAACASMFAGLFLTFAAGAQQVTMKIAFSTVRSGMEHWANTFKAGVERRVGGRVKIDIFPGGQLGIQPSLIRNAQLGALEMAQMPPELLTGVDPRFDIFAAPGLFDDLAHAHRALHEPEFVKSFWPILDSKQLRLVGFVCEAVSDYNSPVPIKTLADFKGKKIRVLGSKLEVEIMRRLEATGVPMEFAEVVPALQTNAIDAVRAGIVIFVPFKFHTFSRNVVRTGESMICPVKFVSKSWFDGVPADLKTIFLEEAAKADEAGIHWNIELNSKLYAAWRDQGGTIFELPVVERTDLRRRLQTVGDEVFRDSPAVKSAYDNLKAAAAKTRK